MQQSDWLSKENIDYILEPLRLATSKKVKYLDVYLNEKEGTPFDAMREALRGAKAQLSIDIFTNLDATMLKGKKIKIMEGLLSPTRKLISKVNDLGAQGVASLLKSPIWETKKQLAAFTDFEEKILERIEALERGEDHLAPLGTNKGSALNDAIKVLLIAYENLAGKRPSATRLTHQKARLGDKEEIVPAGPTFKFLKRCFETIPEGHQALAKAAKGNKASGDPNIYLHNAIKRFRAGTL